MTFSDESEAAFSNYRMWESFGFIIPMAYSNFICTSTKLYILTAFLCAGILGFCIVEYLNWKENKEGLDLVKEEEKLDRESNDTRGSITRF